MLDELLDLLLPVRCLRCAKPPSVLCGNCGAVIAGPGGQVTRGSLQGWSVAAYDAEIAALINHFKENGVTALAKYFGAAMANNIAANVSEADYLVAPPSRPQASIRRGYQPAALLAKALAKQLRAHGRPVRIINNALALGVDIADQSGLGAQARFANLAGTMRVRVPVIGKSVILVDDIVTTGATLLECKRALESAGATVKFFSTFAETKAKNATNNSNWV